MDDNDPFAFASPNRVIAPRVARPGEPLFEVPQRKIRELETHRRESVSVRDPDMTMTMPFLRDVYAEAHRLAQTKPLELTDAHLMQLALFKRGRAGS